VTEPQPKYRCPGCGGECTIDQMGADYFICSEEGDEAWCNYICPHCETWQDLDDYEKLP
jgi:hypothetical protein